MNTATLVTWAICAAVTVAILARPFRWPEAIWAVLGAVMLVLLGLLPLASAWLAVGKGMDVYLFLIGMMLLSETAREQGVSTGLRRWRHAPRRDRQRDF